MSTHQQVAVLTGHTIGVTSINFDVSGKYLASGEITRLKHVDGSGDDADGDVLAGVLVLGLCFCVMMTLFAVLVMGVAATTARLLLRVLVTMMMSMMVTEPMVSRHALTAAALVCRLL